MFRYLLPFPHIKVPHAVPKMASPSLEMSGIMVLIAYLYIQPVVFKSFSGILSLTSVLSLHYTQQRMMCCIRFSIQIIMEAGKLSRLYLGPEKMGVD